MADSAPIVDYVKKPAYPETNSKPKVRRAPQAQAKPARMATAGEVGARKQKPVDAMEKVRRTKVALGVAGMAR